MMLLEAGTDIGGRFRVIGPLREDAGACIYLAADLRTKKQVVIWHISPDVIPDETTLEALRDGVRLACGLDHRNIVKSIGLGQVGDGSYYVAREHVDGPSLVQLVQSKVEQGKTFSPRGAYNILTQMTNALAAAQPKLAHGGLTGESIHISNHGQILISDFGLAALLPHLPAYQESARKIFLAPEIIAGDPPSPQSDVYSIGALLTLLVTGDPSPQGARGAPSRIQNLVPSELDDFVARCMDVNSNGRPADARAVRSQLLAIVETWGTPSLPEGAEWPFDDELSTPVKMGKTTKPAPPMNQQAPVSGQALQQQPAASPKPEAPADPAQSDDLFDAAIADSSAPSSSSGPAESVPPGLDRPPSLSGVDTGDHIDLGSLLTDTTQSENQCWMVQKDNLDHGPFSARELGQQIFAGQVNPDDQVLNMDTGVRQRCVVWPEFTQVVEKAMEKRRQEQEAEALRKVETVEKGVGVARYLIALAVIVVIGVIVGGYFLYRHATRDTGAGTEDVSSDLIAAGGQRIKTGAGILPMERSKNNRRRRRHRGSGGGGGGRGGMSAEEAMMQGVDYGNLSGGGGQLSVGQIQSIMNRNVRRLASCMGGSGGRVNLDLVINGNGSVAGVSVNGPASARGCIASRARGIRFPSFGAPRMRASYYFEVGP